MTLEQTIIVAGIHLFALKGDIQFQIDDLTQVLDEIEQHRNNGAPIILVGDFNANSQHDVGVPLPDTVQVMQLAEAWGLADACREIFPAAAANPGITDREHGTGRIDHILYTPNLLTPIFCEVTGDDEGDPPLSDHCSVLCDFELISP